MDQLISSGYTNFNLTYMNEYGEGIIGFDQARESFTASLTLDNDMVLYDHDLNGSNISAFLTLHNIKPEGKIEKFNHFMNYYAIYNSPKLNKHNIHHYLNVTVDRTVMTADNVDKYLELNEFFLKERCVTGVVPAQRQKIGKLETVS